MRQQQGIWSWGLHRRPAETRTGQRATRPSTWRAPHLSPGPAYALSHPAFRNIPRSLRCSCEGSRRKSQPVTNFARGSPGSHHRHQPSFERGPRRLHEIRVMVGVKLGCPRLAVAEIAADLAQGDAALCHPGAGCVAQRVACAFGDPGARRGAVEAGLAVCDRGAAVANHMVAGCPLVGPAQRGEQRAGHRDDRAPFLCLTLAWRVEVDSAADKVNLFPGQIENRARCRGRSGHRAADVAVPCGRAASPTAAALPRGG